MSEQPDQDKAVGDGASEQQPSPAASPSDTFKQGMGLLWKAARATVDEIKSEVHKGGVGDSLKQAGRDLEDAANQAAKTLESFLDRLGPQETPKDKQGWPAAEPEAAAKPSADDADEASEPNDEAVGSGADMRIQIDEE